jgi:hypothetical protein
MSPELFWPSDRALHGRESASPVVNSIRCRHALPDAFLGSFPSRPHRPQRFLAAPADSLLLILPRLNRLSLSPSLFSLHLCLSARSALSPLSLQLLLPGPSHSPFLLIADPGLQRADPACLSPSLLFSITQQWWSGAYAFYCSRQPNWSEASRARNRREPSNKEIEW